MIRVGAWVRMHWLFTGILILCLITNIIWIARDTSPPLWDMAGHSARVFVFSDFITGFHPKAIWQYDTIYPPATYLVSAGATLLFGRTADGPQLSLLIYVVVALAATYGLGLEWLRSRGRAAFAVGLLASFPLAAHFSRLYDLDYPLMAVTAAAVYALVRSEGFLHRRWSLFFGALAGFGLLTKWTFFVFVSGPLIIEFFRHRAWRRTANLVWAAGLVLLIAAPWYVIHIDDLLRSAEATRQNVFSVPTENLFGPASIAFYINWLTRTLTWPLMSLALLGLMFRCAPAGSGTALWRTWVILPYFIFTFLIASKESRYLLPIFPALAIAIVAFLTALRPRLRIGLTVFAVIVAVFTWIETSWGTRWLSDRTYNALDLESTYGFQEITTERPYYGPTYPTSYHANLDQVFYALVTDARERGHSYPAIAVVPNSIYFSDAQFRLLAARNGWSADFRPSNRVRGGNWREEILKANYIITKTGDQGPAPFRGSLNDIRDEEALAASKIFQEFELIESWELQGIETQPQTARLYRQRTTPK